MKSQPDQSLQAIKDGEQQTPLDALERFGCFRIESRVADLGTRLGHHIVNLEEIWPSRPLQMISPQLPVMAPAFEPKPVVNKMHYLMSKKTDRLLQKLREN